MFLIDINNKYQVIPQILGLITLALCLFNNRFYYFKKFNLKNKKIISPMIRLNKQSAKTLS